jgi:hypothetical protein
MTSRRAFLTGAGALVLAGGAAAQAPGPRFSSVVVDVSHLRAIGASRTADLVQAAMTEEARRVFADRTGPGPRLVIRVTAVSMRSWAGGGEGGFPGGGGIGNDFIEGEALVLGPRHEILARHPQLFAHPANSGGAWYDPDNEGRRVVLLSRYFAQWLRRSLG